MVRRVRGGRLVIGLMAALVAVSPPAFAQQPQTKPAQIDRNGVIILIRSSLLALDQGNKTGNYTVLRDLGAPGFQSNTAAALGDIFAGQRRDRLDLSGVAVIDPQLTILPEIGANGLMHMAGFFPSAPTQINFDLVYAPAGGQWRLFGISVGLGQIGPAAPPDPAPKPEEPPTAAASKPAPAKPAAKSDAGKPSPRSPEPDKQKPER